MSEKRLDVVGIGNAIVDVICNADEGFLIENDMTKGAMTLIDAERAVALYDLMPPGIEASGGSAANTAAGLASLGSRVGYIGKVRDDELGDVFARDIVDIGVDYSMQRATEGLPTARCLIVVTEDAERTMNTFLGVSTELTPNDVDETFVADASLVYCEGYLWDVDSAKAAIRKGMEVAKANDGRVSLTLSDGFCVDRHRSEFRELVDNEVDVLFSNDDELCSLFEVEDFDDAIRAVQGRVEIAAVTRGAEGSLIVLPDRILPVPAWTVDGAVVDTTGAGDLYAAGFLHGLVKGLDLEICGQLGSVAAGEVISHLGPRPLVDLRKLAADEGLI